MGAAPWVPLPPPQAVGPRAQHRTPRPFLWFVVVLLCGFQIVGPRPPCPACHALRLLSPNLQCSPMGKDQFSLLPWLWAPGCYYTLHYPRGVLGRPRNRRLTGGRCRQVGPGSRVGRASLLLFAHIATSPGKKNRQICGTDTLLPRAPEPRSSRPGGWGVGRERSRREGVGGANTTLRCGRRIRC